jgi:hypothetical protein
MARPCWLLGGLGAVVACAAPLSGFQAAHLPAAGHLHAEAGVDVSAPTSSITRAIDAGKAVAVAARQRSLSEDERRRLIEAGANLALNPPAVVMHVAVAYAPLTGWELGLRYASGGWRAGTRMQVLAQEIAGQGVDLSVGLGLSRHATRFPIDEVLVFLALDELTRTSLDLPVLVGKRTSWYRLWGGPRLVLTRFSGALRLDLPNAGSPSEPALAAVGGTAATVAVHGGAAVGYAPAHVFLGVELTVARLFSRARLTVSSSRTDIDLGGLVVSPGLALMGEF